MKRYLKEQCHEEFCLWCFKWKHVPQPTDPHPKAVSNINSYSPRYSNLLLIPRCGPSQGIGIFLQARADLKHEYYRPWVVLFYHTHIFPRLSIWRQQYTLKKNLNDPTVWQSIPWGGPHRGIRSCGRVHSGKSDPPGGATAESPIPVPAHVPVPF